MRLEPLSVRLFPKNKGALGYRLSGIAARCDWVVLSNSNPAQAVLIAPPTIERPRTIFLSMRGGFRALPYFADHVLPRLSAPFVLISGSEDLTIPRQTDTRWRTFNESETAAIARILGSPWLSRWFVENLDDQVDPRMEPLPVGLVFPDGVPDDGILVSEAPPLASRPPRVLVSHRIRPPAGWEAQTGKQWETRQQVTQLARGPWAAFVTLVEQELSEADYMDAIAAHSFVICAEGGGLDPSPKAWHALLGGAIPIIRNSPLKPAYELLPTAFIPDWSAEHLSEDILERWRADLIPYFDDPALRAEVVNRLGIDFWWNRIRAAHPDFGDA
jgi:hypothetical protein